jgi:hypothetical protein
MIERIKIVDGDEKSYNIFYILFSFSVFGLEVVNHPHPERFLLCGNILNNIIF